MEMKVKDALPRLLLAVIDYSEAIVLESQLSCYNRDCDDEMAYQIPVLRGQIQQVGDVFSRDDEAVHRRLRKEVLKTHDSFILIDDCGFYGAVTDFTEDTFHDSLTCLLVLYAPAALCCRSRSC